MNLQLAAFFALAGVAMEILQYFLPKRPIYQHIGLWSIGTGLGFLIPTVAWVDLLVVGVVLVTIDLVRHYRKKRNSNR